MPETTPDPADVHTGTDRVELTEEERDSLLRIQSLAGYPTAAAQVFAAVESIVAARLQALTAERTGLAEKVGRLLEVLQELCAERDAARTEADELRREIQAVAGGALVEEAETSVRRIHAEVERDVARQALTSADAMNRHWDEINAERDRLQAELVAANARCADARCVCGCTWDNHEDAGVRCTSHESCLGFRADLGEGWASYAAEQERNAALQATLDRVTALADEWTTPIANWLRSAYNVQDDSPTAEDVSNERLAAARRMTKMRDDLRAALTPEGKDRADRVDAEDGGR